MLHLAVTDEQKDDLVLALTMAMRDQDLLLRYGRPTGPEAEEARDRAARFSQLRAHITSRQG
ncbi:hypothetical protein [Roseomonas sp. USHLN139]|uniref:hypothetical protein n=1 Tax=Roseomonas sp. USHLN139 TaxID=3081298 RepID=UPI003B019CB9